MSKRSGKLLIYCAFFGLIFLFFVHRFEGSGDFYHHLNSGKYIIENKALPNLDTYTATALNKPWVAHSWASGLIYYLIFTVFGPAGISLYSALIALSLFILLFLLLKTYEAPRPFVPQGRGIFSSFRQGAEIPPKEDKIPERIIFLTLALVAAPVATRWPQRPETVMYPLAVLILLIDRLRYRYPYLSCLLPLVTLAWANLYGSAVIGGLILIAVLVLKQFILDRGRISKPQRLFYLLALLSSPYK